ncbi:MAG: 50S ribosomal protein L35 [Candidatus Kerfeldbacteria bacterium]|nr:50S ribosomal protein L35 [Candidatus Kerfeldbacteria bacterium]
MPKRKHKTHQVIAKRVRRTKNGKRSGKLIIRKAGQDHFNARESGKTTRNKRKDGTASKTITKNIQRVI